MKETLQSHMVMAEEYEALQEEQKSMYHQMEELLALQEGNFSPDKVSSFCFAFYQVCFIFDISASVHISHSRTSS